MLARRRLQLRAPRAAKAGSSRESRFEMALASLTATGLFPGRVPRVCICSAAYMHAAILLPFGFQSRDSPTLFENAIIDNITGIFHSAVASGIYAQHTGTAS